MSQNKCSNEECSKEATMRCPNCVKLEIFENSYFCSQDCFKKIWKTHKTIHGSNSKNQNGHSSTTSDSNNVVKLPHIFKDFEFTGSIRPGIVSPRRIVPEHIKRPDYSETGIPYSERNSKLVGQIEVKNKATIEKLRRVGKMGRDVLEAAKNFAKVGVTTDQIDEVVHNTIIGMNAYPSPLNYRGFPKSCCTSVNEVICHGIPDSRPLEDGDILNIDISVYAEGVHSDVNDTILIGNVDEKKKIS